MSKKYYFAFLVVLVLALAVNSFAVDWTDSGSGHLWSTGSNWSDNNPPLFGEDVYISNGYTGPVIDSTVTALSGIIRMGGTGTVDTLTVSGGSLNASSHLILGQGSGSDARLNISGGSVTVGSLWAGTDGDGIINMTAGTINITDEKLYVSRFGTGQGYINLDGGTITAPDIYMDGGNIDVTEGTLIISGDKRGAINGYISSNWITGDGGTIPLNVVYNGTNTTVTAQSNPYAWNPEPADGYTLQAASLSWQPGAYAASHDVYFGTDFNDVNDAQVPDGDLNFDGDVNVVDFNLLTTQWLTDPGTSDPSADIDGSGIVNLKDFAMLSASWKRPTPYKGNQIATEYTPSETLALGQTYYWRIDEVNEPEVWKGDVWNFSRSFIPQNVTELWSDFDPYGEPLEAQVYREWNETVSGVNIHFKLVRYVVKTWKGQKSIMAAYYAYPVGGTNLPALVHYHGGGQSASGAGLYEMRNHAPRGYAVMSINWGGQDMGDVTNTDWGAINPNFTAGSWQNVLPYPETIDTVESPRNCGWYPVAVAGRRAISFLEQQPEVDADKIGIFGHSMGGTITTYVAGTGDSRVKAAAPSVGGAGYRTYEAYDLGPATARYISGDLELFRRTMDTASYAPYIQCPIFFLGATNDFNSKMDDVYRTFALIPPAVPQRLTFAPHLNHRFDATSDICRYLWFDQYLKGTFTFPQKPASTLSLTEANHIPLFEVTPDDSQTIVAVDLYYSQDKDAVARFWRDAQAVQVGNKWVAQCPLTASSDTLFNYFFAFANVTYRAADGTLFKIASDQHVVTNSMLASAGIIKNDPTSLLMDDFTRGFHDWCQYGSESWTRKTTDPKWHGPSGAKLKLRIKTATTKNFTITLQQNPWRFYRTPRATYSKTVTVSGSANFQDIILNMSDFTGLTRWDWIDELGINPTPEFAELSWVE